MLEMMAVNQDAGDDDDHRHTSIQVALGGGGGRGKYVSCDGDVPVAKPCGRTRQDFSTEEVEPEMGRASICL